MYQQNSLLWSVPFPMISQGEHFLHATPTINMDSKTKDKLEKKRIKKEKRRDKKKKIIYTENKELNKYKNKNRKRR